MERVDWFADLLFEMEVATTYVQAARRVPPQPGAIRAFILSLWEHSVGQDGWFATLEERDALILRIAGGVLAHCEQSPTAKGVRISKSAVADFLAALDLDGYRYTKGSVVRREENAFDVEETSTLLENLYRSAALGNEELFAKSLRKIDEHYETQNWGDSIKHARDVVETTLTEVLRAYAKKKGEQVKASTWGQAFAIRDKLEQLGVLDAHEKEFSKALYSMLSQQGGHPNLSQKDNALICRQHALSAVHFLLLRYQGLASSSS